MEAIGKEKRKFKDGFNQSPCWKVKYPNTVYFTAVSFECALHTPLFSARRFHESRATCWLGASSSSPSPNPFVAIPHTREREYSTLFTRHQSPLCVFCSLFPSPRGKAQAFFSLFSTPPMGPLKIEKLSDHQFHCLSKLLSECIFIWNLRKLKNLLFLLFLVMRMKESYFINQSAVFDFMRYFPIINFLYGSLPKLIIFHFFAHHIPLSYYNIGQ